MSETILTNRSASGLVTSQTDGSTCNVTNTHPGSPYLRYTLTLPLFFKTVSHRATDGSTPHEEMEWLASFRVLLLSKSHNCRQRSPLKGPISEGARFLSSLDFLLECLTEGRAVVERADN